MSRLRRDEQITKPRVGMRVRSFYRAAWYGEIVELLLGGDGNCVRVRVTHDRRGNPMRKAKLHTLSAGWLVEHKKAVRS